MTNLTICSSDILTHELGLQIIRWVHFFAAITWIGILYFFNLVNVPFAKTLDADSKKKVVPELMPRALWWFRYGAMFTVGMGLLYIIWKNFVWLDERSGGLFGNEGLFSSVWGKWITFGGGLGIIMFINVWAVIWPCQKKIINWVKSGQNPPEMAAIGKKALTFSRINFYLSFPMLFGMGGAKHFTQFNAVFVLAVLAVGFIVAWMLVNFSTKLAAKV